MISFSQLKRIPCNGVSIVSSVFFLCCCFAAFADTLILKSGRRIEGKIIEQTEEYIKINIQGISVTYYRDEIAEFNALPKTTIDFSSSRSTSSIGEKTAAQIFKESSPAVVFIQATTSDGPMTGSGFFIDKTGLIVTNYHVVAGARDIMVKMKNGQEYVPTRIVSYSLLKDLCILKIDSSDNLPFLQLEDDSVVEPGEKAFVIGNPMGYEYSISDGIFSGKQSGMIRNLLQFTCPISSGNSGGPLFDMRGLVVGVVTQTLLGNERVAVQNMNFAVSARDVRVLLQSRQDLGLQDFYAKQDEDLAFWDVVSMQSSQDQYNSLRRISDSCRNLEERRCFERYLFCVSFLSYYATDFMRQVHDASVHKRSPDEAFISASRMASEGIQLMESAGGVAKFANLYKRYLSYSDEVYAKTLERTLNNLYFVYGRCAFFSENISEASRCLEKMKETLPADSGSVKLFEDLLRNK